MLLREAPGRTGAIESRAFRRRPCARTVLVAAWVVFVAAHLALSGRWWPWLLLSPLPPATFLVVPAALLVGLLVALRRRRAGRRALAVLALLLVATAVAAFPRSGVVLPEAHAPAGGTGVRVMSWNTEFWDAGDDPVRFAQFLRSADADVYLLQEHWVQTAGDPVALRDTSDVARWLPGYRVVAHGDLVTATRLPIVGLPPASTPGVLPVDVAAGGHVLRTVNTHVPVQMRFEQPLGDFLPDMARRAGDRAAHFADVGRLLDGRGPLPVLVAGDFNSSAAMGEMSALRGRTEDDAAAAGPGYPTTWGMAGLELWRLDWTLSTGPVAATSYRVLDPAGLSDHRAQMVELSVGART